jgi:hypothetical protein
MYLPDSALVAPTETGLNTVTAALWHPLKKVLLNTHVANSARTEQVPLNKYLKWHKMKKILLTHKAEMAQAAS